MEIKQYDTVLLKDGRQGCIVEVLGNQEAFDIDIGSSIEDWETIYSVKKEEIEKVITQ